MTQKLKFRPKARIIRTIGDRLISGPMAAIIELVKNAHDADATYVRLSFSPPFNDSGHGKIVIEDDGHGMSFEDIRDKWMEPATSDKKKRKKSPNGRNMLGSKGIGRFSAARLGDILTLESICKKDSGNIATIVKKIDWKLFEETEYLDEIEFDYTTTETEHPTGTRLIITALRDQWNQNAIKALYRELQGMIDPKYDDSEEGSFSILLDLNEYTKENIGWDGAQVVNPTINTKENKPDWKVRPLPLLDACDYEVNGSFDKKGKFTGTMEIKRGGLKPEKIELLPPRYASSQHDCGEVAVSFYIFDRDKDAVLDMAQRANRGELTYTQARKLIDEIAGVKIYRDNYRIRPYGDRESDWLNLDRQRVQAPTRIGHDQVSGYIIVEDEDASGLIERSSREGFEEGESLERLRALINNLFLVEINRRRYQFRKKIQTDKNDTESSMQDAKILANLTWIEKIIENLSEKEKKSAEETIAKKSAKLIRYLESIEEKHAILEAKIALGMLVAEVIHEGRTPVQFIKAETARLTRWWPTLFDNNSQSSENRIESPKMIKGLYENAEKLKILFDTLQPLSGIKRNKPIKFNPIKLINDTLAVFQSKTETIGVHTQVNNPDLIDEILGHRQDLQPAISNIIDNALYWLEYSETAKPEIIIELKKDGKDCIISISNNGPSILEQYQDSIFDIGFGLKENGSGLGLAIAKETLSRGKGKIEYTPSETAGVTFTITFPFEA